MWNENHLFVLYVRSLSKQMNPWFERENVELYSQKSNAGVVKARHALAAEQNISTSFPANLLIPIGFVRHKRKPGSHSRTNHQI
jgi:hypothetical protein